MVEKAAALAGEKEVLERLYNIHVACGFDTISTGDAGAAAVALPPASNGYNLPIRHGEKTRVIDDYSRSGVNGAFGCHNKLLFGGCSELGAM
eukprot:6466299-Amphidinium_carterae.1